MTTTSSEETDDDDKELPSTSRPAVPQPRVKTPTGTKTRTTQARATQAPAVQRETTTTEAPLAEEKDEEPDVIPEAKTPVLAGRKVVNRVSPRIVNTEATTLPTLAARPISKTRIESMSVPKPVSFTRSKTSQPKQREQPIETTTLEPISIPAFEPTRRSAQKPIIQSISVDNEEEAESDQLPRKKTIRRRVVKRTRLYSSDLAKFSSRVRFAERAPAGPIKFSSYSPPLVNPDDANFIEINRINNNY